MIARFAAATASLIVLAGASSAQATPLAIQGWNGLLELPAAKGSMVWTLGQDCINVEAGGWRTTRSRSRNISTFVQLGTSTLGSLDAVARSGEVHEKKRLAFGFHNLNAKPDRLLEVWDLGVDLRGGRAYLTGRLVKGKPLFAAAKRVRLATIAHPRVVSGNATVPRHPSQTMPNTFLMAVQGNATLAAPLAAALNRIRCHPDPFFAIHPRPVRAGLRFGFIALQLEPSAAIGLAGTVETSAEFESDSDPQPTATAIAPATSVKTGIGLPLVDGARVPMTCVYGQRCEPATGAQLPLAGGIMVTANGRSATIDGIEMSLVPRDPGGSPEEVLAGRVNGQQMDLTALDNNGNARATPQLLQALSAALGVNMTGAFFGPTTTFTKLAAG